MDRKRLVKHLVFLMFFIFIVNLSAQQFHWYFSVWYFDMFMHFLGGFWVGLASLYFFFSASESFGLSLESKALTGIILKILLCVLFIGIGWEIFETSIDKVIVQNSFNVLDTFSDILFDLTGGATTVFYFLKRIMLQSKSGSLGDSLKDRP